MSLTPGVLLALITIIVVFIRTISFGIWVWDDNKPGAFAVFITAIACIGLPIYAMFFRL